MGDPIWIGIDDTDSVKGGCTTYVARTLMKKLADEGYDIIGYPRLVRLNPNIPWKTRGNGALAFKIGNGTGKPLKIGEINGDSFNAYPRIKNDIDSSGYQKIEFLVKKVVEQYAKIDDTNTNPGFVLLKKQPNHCWYTRTVKEIVSLRDVTSNLESIGGRYTSYKNGRGIIGATAAIAWTGQSDKTYELIAYRNKDRWGTKRQVNAESVKRFDKEYRSTFDNYDYLNRHNRIVPNSPCPILYGIRGDNKNDLLHAQKMVKSELVESWILYETNQGTDDHLQRKQIKNVQPYQSVIIAGTVSTLPRTIVGGHVIFSVKDKTGEIDCAAYEPTKEFRRIIRGLVIGDQLDVFGGVREQPLTVNIEKIHIKRFVSVKRKVENPVCPTCGKHMKSKGAHQGFKCRRCGSVSTKPRMVIEKRLIQPGSYEVPVCARRHLSKPLKRMKRKQYHEA